MKLQLFINFITSYVSTFISIGIQFFFIPFLVVTVGISNYGIYTLFLFFSLSGGLSLFDFGLQGTVVKFIAGGIGLNDKEKITKYVVESAMLFFVLGIFFGIFAFIINFFFFNHIYHITNVSNSFILLFSVSAAFNLFIDFIFIHSSSIYEATMRKDLMDILNVTKSIFFAVIVTISFYYFRKDISIVLLLSLFTNCLFTLISIFIGYRLVKSYLTTKNFLLNFTEIFSLFKLSRDLFISRFIGFLDNQFPRIIISSLLPIQFLGMYDIILRIVGIVRTLGSKITQIGLIAYSSMLQEKNDTNGLRELFLNVTKLSLLIILPIIIPLVFFIQTFLKLWLKSEYIEVESLIQIYLFQLLLTTLINVGGIMLVGLHKVRIILKLSTIIFTVATFFSFLGTYFWGLMGLAICTTVSTMIMVPLYLRKLLIEFNITPVAFFKKVLSAHIIISVILSIAFSLFIHSYIPSSLFDVLVIFMITGIIYMAAYFILGLHANEKLLIKGYIDKLRKR